MPFVISQTTVQRTHVIRNGKWEPGPDTEGGGRSGIILLF